jgi:hypothetical protein
LLRIWRVDGSYRKDPLLCLARSSRPLELLPGTAQPAGSRCANLFVMNVHGSEY